MIRTFRREGVEQIVMAGKVTKSVMYTPWRFVQLWPDLRMIHMWYRTCRADKRDDSILLAVIAEFERDGMTFASALDYCPELLVNAGTLTRRGPTAQEWKDIDFGWDLAKEMGRLDVGQSVAVKERAALAVEAIEGTDRCIERAGAALPGRRLDAGQGRQAAAGHAVRRPHRRDLDDREPAPGPRPGPGDRGGQDHRHRPARGGRAGRPLRPGDRRPHAGLRDRPDRRGPSTTGPGRAPSGAIPPRRRGRGPPPRPRSPGCSSRARGRNWCGSVGSARCIVRSNWARRRSRSRAARRAVRIETPIRSASRAALAFSGAMIRTESVDSLGRRKPAPLPTITDSPARPIASISLARWSRYASCGA